MNAILGGLAVSLLLAACASGPTPRWDKPGATAADFATDHDGCAARATRVTPTARADQLPGGVSAPRNRMDAPPRHWAHPVADRAYRECMAERGWRVVG